MKKRNLSTLQLNKRSISSLKEVIKGGFRSPSDCTSLGNGDPCPESHDCETQ
ncbi:hypothetical protein H2O64_18070 [Kordia sp. YSTF-M3]|uniref:Bacteriocin n=1 Tax=Kordia aestuariivivens TaxID=2759037 RepID=A0ABR7QDE1_9FLAO|nr:hypothetical protein [Kordia aestuariivivens]MBC8756584.1 hypothetical protein [Kordia aestuariivivens]